MQKKTSWRAVFRGEKPEEAVATSNMGFAAVLDARVVQYLKKRPAIKFQCHASWFILFETRLLRFIKQIYIARGKKKRDLSLIKGTNAGIIVDGKQETEL